MPPQAAIATGYDKASGTIFDSNMTALAGRRGAVRVRYRPAEGLRDHHDRRHPDLRLHRGDRVARHRHLDLRRSPQDQVRGHLTGAPDHENFPVEPDPERHQHRLHAHALGVAGVALLLAVVAIGAIAFKGFNFALDFTGGTVVEVRFDRPADVDGVRERLAAAGFEGAQVQTYRRRQRPADPPAAARRRRPAPTPTTAPHSDVLAAASTAGQRRQDHAQRVRRPAGRQGTRAQRPVRADLRGGRLPDLHLVPLRMEVRGGGHPHHPARRADRGGLLRADRARVRPHACWPACCR